MLQYEKIDVSEGIDVNKTSASKECELWHHWFLKILDFNLKNVCNRCHDSLTMVYCFKKYSYIDCKKELLLEVF